MRIPSNILIGYLDLIHNDTAVIVRRPRPYRTFGSAGSNARML